MPPTIKLLFSDGNTIYVPKSSVGGVFGEALLKACDERDDKAMKRLEKAVTGVRENFEKGMAGF